jgi:fermentation-respiration switch protein FrsA (DUF1100 family)
MQQHFNLMINGKRIMGTLHLPNASSDRVPCVIACHGLLSSKQSPKFISIAEHFSRNGIAVIRFSFSGCGDSSGNISDTTVTGRLQELEHIYDFASRHPNLGGGIGLLGSSLGGFSALFFASAHPQIKALSVWATPYDLEEAGSNMPPENLDVLNDMFFTDAARYDLSSVLERIKAVQVIQGGKDSIVPLWHAKKIFNSICDPKQLKIFPEGDHSISDPEDRDKAITAAFEWFRRFLHKG